MLDRRFVLHAALVSILPSLTLAKSISPLTEPLQVWLKNQMAAKKVPGMAVALSRDDRPSVIWTSGLASVDPDPTMVMSPSILMPLDSVSKHIAGLAVLDLVDRGRLGLDDKLAAHVAGTPQTWSGVTVRHLLTHTSGISDYWSLYPNWTRPQPRAELLSRLGAQPVLFPPGAAWSYSNMNYRLLGWLVADSEKRPYAEVLRRGLFDRAGLPNARLDAAQDKIATRAYSYNTIEGATRPVAAESNDLSGGAEGGVLFSARDASQWGAALDSGHLLPARLTRQATTRTRIASEREIPYGFGWYLDKMRGADCQWHGGSGPGSVAYALRLPAHGLSIYLMANSFAASSFIRHAGLGVAEAYAPGSTYLGAPVLGDGSDARTTRVRAILSDGDFPDAWLAPEAILQRRAQGGSFGGFHQPIAALAPVEEYPVERGTMRRYRIRMGSGEDRYALVGWTEDERIFWNNA